MSRNIYKEASLTLADRKLSFFEEGRDAGALPMLFGIKDNVRYQERALLECVTNMIRGLKREPVDLYLFDKDLVYLRLAVTYRFGYNSEDTIRFFAKDLIHIQLSKFGEEIAVKHNNIVQIIEHSMPTTEDKSGRFSICIFPPISDFDQRAAIQFFSCGHRGAIFVRDFSLQATKWPFQAYRELGYDLVESADGYGYVYFLSSNPGGYK